MLIATVLQTLTSNFVYPLGIVRGMSQGLVAVNLSRTHRRGTTEVTALADATLRIPPGSFFTVTGPSGSGKSTLLQLLGLLDRPTGGRVTIDGVDTSTLGDDEQARQRRTNFGFVFQSFHLLPGLTAWENVAMPRLLDGVSLKASRGPAIEFLNEVGLGERADHRPSELSGGELQRVAIARALIAQPGVVLADEPTGALDQTTSGEIIELLVRLTIDRGRTLVIVTHDPTIASHPRATNVRLRDGRIVSGDA